jgi:hypothetical protein
MKKNAQGPDVSSTRLLAAARHLFKTGHKASPFMTLDSGPNGCSLAMKFKTLGDGQAVHASLVQFFTANAPDQARLQPSPEAGSSARTEAGGPEIPGGWRIGSRCYFSHPEKKGLLGCRVVGTIEGYDPATNVLSINYEGQIIKQQHTLELGGISGVVSNDAPEPRDERAYAPGACSASILGAGLPTVTITNTVAVVDRAGVVHSVEVAIRARLDKGHVSDLILTSVSPAPEGVSDVSLLESALGYSPNDADLARKSSEAAGSEVDGEDGMSKLRIWLEEIPADGRNPRLPGGWFIQKGSRSNEFIYDRSPDSSDQRIRYYDRKSDVVRWMRAMRQLGYECKSDPSFRVTEEF